MKRLLPYFITVPLAIATLGGLTACQGFSDGIPVKAKVARLLGEPCKISVELYDNVKAQRVMMLARLETSECLRPPAPNQEPTD